MHPSYNIVGTEAGLPTDLPYFNLNCFSKASGSTLPMLMLDDKYVQGNHV